MNKRIAIKVFKRYVEAKPFGYRERPPEYRACPYPKRRSEDALCIVHRLTRRALVAGAYTEGQCIVGDIDDACVRDRWATIDGQRVFFKAKRRPKFHRWRMRYPDKRARKAA